MSKNKHTNKTKNKNTQEKDIQYPNIPNNFTTILKEIDNTIPNGGDRLMKLTEDIIHTNIELVKKDQEHTINMEKIQVENQERRQNKYAKARIAIAYIETIGVQIFALGALPIAGIITIIIDINITLGVTLISSPLAYITLLKIYRKFSRNKKQ